MTIAAAIAQKSRPEEPADRQADPVREAPGAGRLHGAVLAAVGVAGPSSVGGPSAHTWAVYFFID